MAMDSVYSLLNALCESFFIDSGVNCDGGDKAKVIKLCRKKAFEILFEAGNASTKEPQIVKIIEEYQVYIFEQRLSADTVRKNFRIGQLETILKKIALRARDETTNRVLELLFCLRDGAPDSNEPMVSELTAQLPTNPLE